MIIKLKAENGLVLLA